MGEELKLQITPTSNSASDVIINKLSVNEFKFIFDLVKRDMVITKIEHPENLSIMRAEIEYRVRGGAVIYVELEELGWHVVVPKDKKVLDGGEYIFYSFEEMFDVVTNRKYKLLY